MMNETDAEGAVRAGRIGRLEQGLYGTMALALLTILAGGAWFYHDQEQHVRRQAEAELASVARIKANQIVQWRTQRLADASVLLDSVYLNEAVAKWMKTPDSAEAEKILFRFRSTAKHYHYRDVLLVDAGGRVRLSVTGGGGRIHEEAAQAVATAQRDRRPVLTDLHAGPGDLPPHLDVVAPLVAPNSGAVILQCDAREFLYPLILSWPVPSATAETLLVRRDGDNVLFLSELRHQKDAALKLRIPLTRRDVPAVMAVLGKDGAMQGTDDRGAGVLSVLQAVPGSPWFLATQKDNQEVFAPLRQDAWVTGIIVALLILIVALTLVFVWRQKAAAEALREREESLTVTLHSIGDGVLATDAGGRVTRLNAVAEQLTGWTAAEAKGRPVGEVFRIINEETRQPAAVPVDTVLRTGAIHGLGNHTVLLARDGAEHPIADSAAPIRDRAGRLLGVVLVFRDVSAERRAEREIHRLNDDLEQRVRERTSELRASEERFRMTVEGVRDYAILMLDTEGHVISWNAGAERIKGYQADEIIGQPVSRFYPREDVERGKPEQELAIAAGDGRFEDESWRVRKDGSRFWANVVITALRDDAGRLCGFSKITRDITERKRAEEELRNLNAELEQRVEERTRELACAKEAAETANRAKSEFLANVSHEVRTPMNAIMGMTDLVLETPLTGEQRRLLATVRESADSLLGVLNDILDFAKIEAGRLELEETPFGLRDVVEGTAATLAERAHRKGLELACQVPAEVPDALVGDPGRLRQILVNLIGNAIKFTPRGEVAVRVAVEMAREHDVTLHFSVADTGIGIPPEKQKVVFEPFRQADASTTRQYGGTGLGLAISSQLTARMQGRIWAESPSPRLRAGEGGKGSVFHFTARFGMATGAQPPLPASLAELKGQRVLIVDDNATNRFIYEEMIGAWGMRPTVTGSGEKALAAAAAAQAAGDPFALVLVDRQMPGMDGCELAGRLRGIPEFAKLVLIMLSSSGDLGDAERRRKLDIAACLVKPVRQSELLNTIMRAMGLVTGGTCRAAETPGARPLKILLAEDYPLNQELAVQLLSKRGHAVVVAENGQDALRRLETDDFDVVLMDVQMPVMDGYTATAAIRDPNSAVRRHDIPIVAMTAHAMKGDRERCLAAGMNGYVSKPFTAADLNHALTALFGAEPGGEPTTTPTPPAPTPPDAAVFDRTAVLERMEGDETLAKRMVTRFLESVPALLADLDAAAQAADTEAFTRHAHTLKGAAATLGGHRAQAACRRLETAARAGDLQAAKAMIVEATREIGALEQALKAFVNVETGREAP